MNGQDVFQCFLQGDIRKLSRDLTRNRGGDDDIHVSLFGQGLDHVLTLRANDILNRRLQTIVFKKGYASTIKGARQMISHGHVYVGDRRMAFPSYVVPVEKERLIKVEGLKGGKR